ncbi:MAG: hypothetical protein SGPRY_005110, partial [Prymnesium sp.]
LIKLLADDCQAVFQAVMLHLLKLTLLATLPALALALARRSLRKDASSPRKHSIVANLLVPDIKKTIEWYTSILGCEIGFTVDAAKGFSMGEVREGSVFGMVKLGEAEIMLQTPSSLCEDLPSVFSTQSRPSISGTLYVRGVDPDEVISRLDQASILKTPTQEWYGMYEMYGRWAVRHSETEEARGMKERSARAALCCGDAASPRVSKRLDPRAPATMQSTTATLPASSHPWVSF